MAESGESGGDRTEAATPRRRQEAQEQGNIARSPDLSSAVLLLGTLMLMRGMGLGIVTALRAVVAEMLGKDSLSSLDAGPIAGQLLHVLGLVGESMAPFLGGVVLIGIAVNLAQVGFNPNMERLSPNFAALNPIRGLSRVFASGQSLAHLAINILKVVLVGLVVWSAIGSRMEAIVAAQQLSFVQIFGLGCDVLYAIGLRIGMLLLFLAVIDYGYQRYRVEQSLRMTRQEVKDEMRRMEGDPQLKLRRRQLAIQRMQKKLKKDVPTADVVVTNPTHYAVALKYDESMHAPKVIAKGVDFMAFRIRELAIEAGVPIVERAELARTIYRLVAVGREIPEQCYAAVAEILAYVYELSRRAKAARGGRPLRVG